MNALEIAAMMIGGPRVGSGQLHYDLYNTISRATELVSQAGGELRSRQAIAAIIASWEMANPGVSPIGE